MVRPIFPQLISFKRGYILSETESTTWWPASLIWNGFGLLIFFATKTDGGEPICTLKMVFHKFTLQLQKAEEDYYLDSKVFSEEPARSIKEFTSDTKSLGRAVLDKFTGKNGRNLIPGKSVIAQVVPVD